MHAYQGWNDGIYNHLTARVPSPEGTHHFLINAFGLGCE
jgi:ribulose-5-phosphate 4-epimerase/fuculose-1-phosphate aldolase